jgi:hypothetical protein
VGKSNASATSNSIVTELGEIGKKRAEALVAVQAELLNTLQAISSIGLRVRNRRPILLPS